MWRKLAVDVLGYKRFGAQGGDWGAPITIALAHDHADVVGAFHLNLLFLRPSGQLSPAETQWYAMAADYTAR